MVKKLTNRLLGIFSVMMLMLMTSLSANATCYLAGSATDWQNGRIAMEERGDGIWTTTKAFAEGETFKIMVDDAWYGMPAGEGTNYWVTASILNKGTVMEMNGSANLDVRVAGTYTLLFDSNLKTLRMGAKAPVTVKNNDAHGSVSVNPTEAIPGETITITATPNDGYYTDVDHITVEKTINGGSAQAPGMKDGPGVGQYVENIQAGEEANTFTFAMPEAPYGAQVSAEFLLNTVHNVIIDENIENGSVAADPTSGEEGDEITLTITPETGYELDVLTVGGATVTVTGNTYTFTMGDADVHVNATFKKINYELTVTSNEYGSVTVQGKELVENKTTATFEESITLNIAANEDCELQELKVDGQVVEVTGNTYTFTMPSHAVAVEATFRAKVVSYEMRWGTGDPWSDQHAVVLAKDETTGKLVANNNIIPAQYEAVLVKIVDGEEFLMGADTQGQGDYWITVGYIANPVDISMDNMDNYHRNLYFPSAGEYNFSYDPSEKKLKVTGEFIYNVTITEPQHGSVTANPTSGKKDTEITLTITPDTGYEVGNISVTYGNNQTVDVTDNDDGTYTFQMPAGDVTVTVTFNPKTYNITVAESTNGKVTAPESAACGSTVTLIVEPDEDCVLQSLTVTYGENNTPVEVANNQFTMPAGDVTVTATFRALEVSYEMRWGTGDPWSDQHAVVLAKDETTGKLVANNNIIPAQYEAVLVKIVDGQEILMGADTQGQGDYWITVGYIANPVDISMGVMDNYHHNLYFPSAGEYNFSYDPSEKKLKVTGAIEYKITYESTENGTVTGPDKALNGNPVELTVTPADDTYLVGNISVTYEYEGETHSVEVTLDNETGKYTFEMPASDVTVAVTFTKILANNPLTWNVTNASLEVKVDNAAITSGTEVQEGKEVNVTISQTPEQVAEWTISKVTIVYSTTTTELTATEGVYTFEMPAAATEIKVEFTAVQHNITVADNEYVTVDAPATAAAGQEVTITVTPNDDFVVTGVTVNDGDVVVTDNEDGTYTFTMPEGADGVEVDITVAAKIQGVSFTAERNWATYIGAYDLAKPAGVEAIYVVTGVQGDAVVIESVDYIPANKGVLLYSEDAGENFVAELYAGDLVATISTKLVGSATASTTSTIEDYVLYDNNFIRSQGGSVAAHRCYLPGTEVQGAPRMLKIGYNGDVPTAIETLIAEGNVANVKYVNMSGMTSDKPFNGINIAVVTFTDGTTKAIKLVK